MKKFLHLLKLDEEKPLYKHWLFWLAVLLPALLAFLFSLPLMGGLSWDLSSKGYGVFALEFKFPLWILSGSLLFGVIVGRFHASKQRVKALQQTESNNNFRNYFEHRDMAMERLGTRVRIVSSLNNGIVYRGEIEPREVYRWAFPENSIARFNPEMDDRATARLQENLIKYLLSCDAGKHEDAERYRSDIDLLLMNFRGVTSEKDSGCDQKVKAAYKKIESNNPSLDYIQISDIVHSTLIRIELVRILRDIAIYPIVLTMLQVSKTSVMGFEYYNSLNVIFDKEDTT